MFGSVRLVFGTILENLRKSSESGRKSSEKHKKRRYQYVYIITRRIFAFTRALCWGETLVLLHVVSQGFFCNDGLSCNGFCIGMLKMQGYYLCSIQVENIVVM